MDQTLIKIYSQPMMGGELPYFQGRQHGNGWLRTLGKLAFPIVKRAAKGIATMAADTAEDVIVRENKFLPSLQANARAAASNFLRGKSLKRKRQSINKKKSNLAIKLKRK